MNFCLISSAYSDYKFPQISQVENIVHLRRSWLQFFQTFTVELDAMFEQSVDLLLLRVSLE